MRSAIRVGFNRHLKDQVAAFCRDKKGTDQPPDGGEHDRPFTKAVLSKGVRHSAAFIWKPSSILSEGATGYWPEKQASQNWGLSLSRP